MQLIVNGTPYELDRKVVETQLINTVQNKVQDVESQAPHFLTSMVRHTIGAVMAFLGRNHPELRKPDDMDSIEHAARAIAKLVLDEWEKHPLEVSADEPNPN